MNRYLFLDIDGVLNSEKSVLATNQLIYVNLVKGRMERGEPLNSCFDPHSVKLLQRAQKELQFKIIISSTWRINMSVQEFHLLFDEYGWDTRDIIIGKTTQDGSHRGTQIQSWVQLYAKHPYAYCILDDSTDFLQEQLRNLVLTTFLHGLDADAFKKIYEVFGEKLSEVRIIYK